MPKLSSSTTSETEHLQSPAIQRTVAFHTLGCKANQLETSTLAHQFQEQGWQMVPFDEAAEVYVINTCTVTERSDNESRRMIRRARLSNPQARIAVTGCYAQVSPDELAGLDGVSFVIGNNFKDQIVNIVETAPISEQPLVKVSEIDKSRIMVGASSAAIDRTRGSLKIQDGCDYKCTYCIIWEARGLSRSLPVEDVKYQLKRMLEGGFKEIMLTGINIGQYEHDGQDLADLLNELITLPGQFRLRLTSLDPMEVSDKLIETVAKSDGKICPHFHLSAQSAEDYVLKRMGRRHHVADMVRVCETIARHLPHASVGSDIIVGFPGETAERFEATYTTLKSTYMNYFHVFSYSKRKGTPAASFPDQVPEREKKARAQHLRDLSDTKSLSYRRQFIGQELAVIVEEGCEQGMSENYLKVQLNANGFALQPNDWALLEITSVDAEQTHAIVRSVLPAH
ncbi:MAG: tRNA ((6)-L-threonylcarbamoyladenosine(37)-C(2))-methylthiotransferase MtaB [Vampirovibrio sp.]|jgi:threonylcarbamoyladenosine tRNA methylthiotransferase MtaB|nr:tRNA ((6)-L-threonylcarbamoyladenosine(37)-C(2))-methylthiotransferase MtaB [Vampirovibrio sp.]